MKPTILLLSLSLCLLTTGFTAPPSIIEKIQQQMDAQQPDAPYAPLIQERPPVRYEMQIEVADPFIADAADSPETTSPARTRNSPSWMPVNPTANDDATLGFTSGSIWFSSKGSEDPSKANTWICIDPLVGKAVWLKVPPVEETDWKAILGASGLAFVVGLVVGAWPAPTDDTETDPQPLPFTD